MSELFHCWCVRAVTAALMSIGFLAGDSLAGEGDFIVRSERHPAEVRILNALDEPTEVQFIEAPLSDVLLHLQERHGFQIVPDQLALDDAGVGTDTPVTIDLTEISLRAALKLMLRNLQLTYAIRDEVLLITTPEVQQDRQVTKVYAVADLVEDSSAEDLADVLHSMRGDEENTGRIVAYRNLLIIRETDRVHDELSKLLSLMRRGLETTVTSRPGPDPFSR